MFRFNIQTVPVFFYNIKILVENTQFPKPNTQFPKPNTQFPKPNSQFPKPNSQNKTVGFVSALGIWRAPKAVRAGTSAVMDFRKWEAFFKRSAAKYGSDSGPRKKPDPERSEGECPK